ncbi:hypothetical protein L873DRAFT_1824557, partial [Choiromyces venosus 120613-1]
MPEANKNISPAAPKCKAASDPRYSIFLPTNQPDIKKNDKKKGAAQCGHRPLRLHKASLDKAETDDILHDSYLAII